MCLLGGFAQLGSQRINSVFTNIGMPGLSLLRRQGLWGVRSGDGEHSRPFAFLTGRQGSLGTCTFLALMATIYFCREYNKCCTEMKVFLASFLLPQLFCYFKREEG